MVNEHTIDSMIYCHRCKNETFHEYMLKDNKLLQHIEEPEGEELEHTNWYKFTYSIIRCRGCHNISFLETNLFEEDYYIHNDRKRTEGNNFIDYDPTQFIPYPSPPIVGEKNMYQQLLDQRNVHFKHLPINIKELQKEVITAFANGSHYLCGIGLRMIIEAICENLDIRNPRDKKGNLQKDEKGNFIKLSLYSMIKKLRKMGLITESQKHVLNQIREMGNDTVHVLRKHNFTIIFQSIIIVDDILMNIYEYHQIELYNKNKSI